MWESTVGWLASTAGMWASTAGWWASRLRITPENSFTIACHQVMACGSPKAAAAQCVHAGSSVPCAHLGWWESRPGWSASRPGWWVSMRGWWESMLGW